MKRKEWVDLGALVRPDMKAAIVQAARTASDAEGRRVSEAEIVRRALGVYLASVETGAAHD